MNRRATARPEERAATSNDLAGRPVNSQPTSPVRVFEVRPLRRMDLANVTAVRTTSYWDALVAAGRMSDHGCPCIVWMRRTEAVAA